MISVGNTSDVNLDTSIFNAVGNKGTSSNNVGLNKAFDIRLYSGKEKPYEGHNLIVSVEEGYKIVDITITYVNDSYGPATVSVNDKASWLPDLLMIV